MVVLKVTQPVTPVQTRRRLTAPGMLSMVQARAFRDAFAWSRLVARAKLVLPVLSVMLIVMIAVWPLLSGSNDAIPADDDSGKLEMVGARYRGTDTTRRPFEVRFEKALQNAGGETVELVQPEAEMTLNGGQWLTISAENGHFDQKSGRLSLSGKVTLFHDGGYEFQTEQAELDTEKGVVWGNLPVRGQGPTGDVEAGGFRILESGGTVVFTGKARMRLISGTAAAGRAG
jgi:lipopolysaccharide export system protein LptC